MPWSDRTSVTTALGSRASFADNSYDSDVIYDSDMEYESEGLASWGSRTIPTGTWTTR